MPYHTFVFLTSLLALLFSFFLFILFFFFSLLSISFSFFPMFPIVLPCFPFVVYCAQLRSFYTICCDKIYHFTLQLPLACCKCSSLATHQFAGCPATTTTLCWLCHVPFPDEESFVLFSCFSQHFHPDKGQVFSLTNSYGMHLVILAHLSFFWVVCHPSRTFP